MKRVDRSGDRQGGCRRATSARLDLAAIARQVIDDIDLPEILQQSTGAVSFEAGRRDPRREHARGRGRRSLRRQGAAAEADGPAVSVHQGEGNAGLVTRPLAATVDAIAVVIGTVGLYLGAAGIRLSWSPLQFHWPQPSTWVSTFMLALVATVYLTIAWATTGRSYGATLLGVRVLARSRRRLGWIRAMLRAVVCVLVPIGLLWTAAISPRLRAITALAVSAPLLIVVFAATDYLIAASDPTSFSQPLDCTAALYFAVTVLATVGFGDIAPVTTVARVATMVQMLLDLAILGLAAKVLFDAADRGVRNRAADERTDDEGGRPG